VPGWRKKVYKYMHIYLWTTLRIVVSVRERQDDKVIFWFSVSDLVGGVLTGLTRITRRAKKAPDPLFF